MKSSIAHWRVVRRGSNLALLLLSSGLIQGCASFSSLPEPVLRTQDVLGITSNYPVSRALQLYHAARDSDREGLTSRQWRDMVVGVYMAAADARYHEFRTNLSREMRGGNFGLDFAVLGLSGAGTVSGQAAANVLAAITGALTGTRTALSKDVYFEQALPALAASMEAARLEVATRIHTGLTKSIEEYPLERAFTDVLAYERAASLDQAVQRITVSAAVDVTTQQAAFARIERVSATVPTAMLPLVRRVSDTITALYNRQANDPQAAQNLQFVIAEFGVDASKPVAEQVEDAIDEVVELSVTPGALEAHVANLRTQHGVDLAP